MTPATPDLLAALRAVEYVQAEDLIGREIKACPLCFREEEHGHTGECLIGNAIAAAESRAPAVSAPEHPDLLEAASEAAAVNPCQCGVVGCWKCDLLCAVVRREFSAVPAVSPGLVEAAKHILWLIDEGWLIHAVPLTDAKMADNPDVKRLRAALQSEESRGADAAAVPTKKRN